jgi:cell division control protein 6
MLVTRSPRKPRTPIKHCSPVKAAHTPLKPAPTPLFQVDVSQFQSARAALHTGTPSYLLCREQQVDTMSKWLDKHLVQGKPGSMYVSGAPGTGKTATLTHLLNTKTLEFKSIFINCMVLKSSIAIYREVAKQLAPKLTPKTEKDALKVIENAITTSKTMTLLVLDEVDQLDSKNQSVLYTVFEWPALQSSTLALVGIANSLDLTNRVLPRLQVSPAYKPTLLHYPPYTKHQIIDILSARLKEGGETGAHPVITPRAIAYLAGKISSLSGDIRKALDVCRRALELAETLTRKQTLLKLMTPRGLASPAQSPRKGYKNPKMLPQIGQVDMPQIMKVLNQVYGSQVTASLGTKGEGLPIKQKILIASLLLMVKKGKSKEVTLGKLAETFTKILKKRSFDPEHEAACIGMIEMLESRGMVSYLCKGAPRMAKVSLRMDEDEVALALEDKAMLAGIIEDVTCIAK